MSKCIITNICPKCGGLMEVREHASLTEAKLKKLYYFVMWHYCKKCKHLQHYEKFKKYN